MPMKLWFLSVVNIIRYGNPDLKWETTTQTNFGWIWYIIQQ
jgi:outer membrane receptor protein involved in Fe transport